MSTKRRKSPGVAMAKSGRKSLAKKASKLGLITAPATMPMRETPKPILAQPDRRTYVSSVTTYSVYQKPI